MEFSFISDTHGRHDDVKLRGGDALFHCGDVSKFGKVDELLNFFSWFSKQDYQHKIFIAGNRDMSFDSSFGIDARSFIMNHIPSKVTYLENISTIISGLKIWGSPCTPRFNSHAFNIDRGAAIAAHWKQIPHDVDILLTHGPARSILDVNYHNESTGCDELATIFQDPLYNIKIHACGHIHESRGMVQIGNTRHINASSSDRLMKTMHESVNVHYKA